MVSAGYDADFQGLVRCMYAFGFRIPADSAAHAIGRSHKFVDSIYKLCRHVFAFRQMQLNDQVIFGAGIVEWDEVRTSGRKDKKSKSTTHVGRFLVEMHRIFKQTVLYPLPDRATKAGAPGPPDSTAEVLPWLQKKVHAKQHVIASDSSIALASAWNKLNVVSATAVHSKDEYTPVKKLLVKKLGAEALKSLKHYKRAIVGTRKITVVGGDQCGEGAFSVLKRLLLRQNLLGRSSLNRATVDGLATQFLSSNTGFQSIAEAFSAYRMFISDTVSPKLAFQQLQFLDVDA